MEFEILSNIYAICKKKKVSEREISFLMGKDNKYFAKHINPFTKEQIMTEYLDSLRSIASTSFQRIVPNHVKAKETIDIVGTHYTYSDDTIEKIQYKFTVTYMDKTSKNFRWYIEIPKGERSVVNKELLEILKKMVTEKYFDTPKYALTIHLYLKKKYKSKFTALELQIALAKLCNAKAEPAYALKVSKDNMKDVYGR
ncbi:hypothetical protein [Sphingobacterium luzhongxinii]|uniref:hypothetical protein n=1 Tax=Sphingobacterium luzhongxinii TaxID=2654181 RepID=UPI00196A02E2|nr:hypothetical protein [Sphingobacterium sp. xlx-73]